LTDFYYSILKYYADICTEGLWKNHKTSVRRVSVEAKIPNSMLEPLITDRLILSGQT